MAKRDPFAALDDDDLAMPNDVGPWAEEKYRLLYHYANAFATAMKNKWDHLIYIDLFASAGRARLRETGKIVRSSPLLALEIIDPFDRYIFCEKDTNLIGVLKRRVRSGYPGADAKYIKGDVNECIDKVIKYIPVPSRANTVLGLCFVDPFKMENLHFATIARLANYLMDFLVLIPTHMDAARNVDNYCNPSNHTVEKYLDKPNWRAEWDEVRALNPNFKMYIADTFSRRMTSLRYEYGGLPDSVLVRWKLRNLKLYLLGLYSRHKLGAELWKDVKKYSGKQQELFG